MVQPKRKKGEAPDPALTNEMLRRAALGGAAEMGNPVYDAAQLLGSSLAAPHLRAIAEHDARQAAQAGYAPVPARGLQPNYHPPKNWAEHAMDVMNPVTDAAQQMMANPGDVFDIRRPGVPEGQMGYLGALGAGLAQPPMPRGMKIPRGAVAPGVSPAGATILAARMSQPVPERVNAMVTRPHVPPPTVPPRGPINPHFQPTGNANKIQYHAVRLDKVPVPKFEAAYHNAGISSFQKAIRSGDYAKAQRLYDHEARRYDRRVSSTPETDAIYDYMQAVMDVLPPTPTRRAPWGATRSSNSNAPTLGGERLQQPNPYSPVISEGEQLYDPEGFIRRGY